MRDEDLVVGHQQPNVVHGSGGHKPRKLFKIIMTLLLAVGLSASAYIYQTSSQEMSRLENENQSLRDAIDQKNSIIVKLREGLVDGSGGSCDAGAEYTAEVGKFTVKLNKPNVIVRNLDDTFEGGPATVLDVASCIQGQLNVFDKPPLKEVTITANPNQTSADLKSAYESNFGAPSTTGTATVAGVTAEENKYTGLFAPTVLFFDNDGIGYQIELGDTSTDTEAILTDITEDWEFVSS